MKQFIPDVKQGFTDDKNRFYPNIREIAYEQGKTFGSFGTLIGESGRKDYSGEDIIDGVYVFRSYIDPTKVYRIYKDFIYPDFNNVDDAKFISNLLNQGKAVKLSDLPTGVITEGGRVIGQEVPFVEGITLRDFSRSDHKDILPTKIYIQMLDIIKELYINKIYYLDIHERNFMINNGIVKLIDFEKFFIRINDITIGDRRLMFDYLKMTIEELNKNFNIPDKIGTIDGFDDAYEKVLRLEQKLINREYNQ